MYTLKNITAFFIYIIAAPRPVQRLFRFIFRVTYKTSHSNFPYHLSLGGSLAEGHFLPFISDVDINIIVKNLDIIPRPKEKKDLPYKFMGSKINYTMIFEPLSLWYKNIPIMYAFPEHLQIDRPDLDIFEKSDPKKLWFFYTQLCFQRVDKFYRNAFFSNFKVQNFHYEKNSISKFHHLSEKLSFLKEGQIKNITPLSFTLKTFNPFVIRKARTEQLRKHYQYLIQNLELLHSHHSNIFWPIKKMTKEMTVQGTLDYQVINKIIIIKNPFTGEIRKYASSFEQHRKEKDSFYFSKELDSLYHLRPGHIFYAVFLHLQNKAKDREVLHTYICSEFFTGLTLSSRDLFHQEKKLDVAFIIYPYFAMFHRLLYEGILSFDTNENLKTLSHNDGYKERCKQFVYDRSLPNWDEITQDFEMILWDSKRMGEDIFG